ncbi:MAG: bifunctional uridylyltransferase/uridylyl-removing protein, partial [Oxalobacteraceae bacterium]|nr:bifunctional uridylyltransferase/uridylyl-removing protein [Oxalobacteraceae bacterium]
MDARAFFQDKVLELRQRHVKYENTPYSLEPNCKESPGGLRDLQVIIWVSKAAGLGRSWRELADSQIITRTEARQLAEKERAFKDIRIRLHLYAGRREDRLVFDVQGPIADTFGFTASDDRRASEVLMQRYYWAAKAVTQLNSILLLNIESRLFPQPLASRPVNERFNEVNGMIDIAHDDVFEQTPSAMLEIFLLLERNGELKGMTARTQRALWHARFRIDASFRRDPKNRELFLHILQAPKGVTHAFLVEHHLLMSQVAQKQDLSDPDVIRAFVKTVKTERRLTALYLLTVADIRGTSPKVWNAWKGKLLEDLYRMSLRVLGGEAPSTDRVLQNRQQEARAMLRLHGLPDETHDAFWKRLDVGYFLRHDAAEIAWHTRVLHEHLDDEQPLVRCRIAPIGEGLQVVVYLRDRTDLFARICAYFDRHNFSILDAKVQTTRNGYALDTFLVSEPSFSENYRELIALVEHDLALWVQSDSSLPTPGKARLSRLS